MERVRQLQRHIVPSPVAQSATPLAETDDLSLLNGVLTDQQRKIRARVHALSNRILGTPEMREYYENAQFPFETLAEFKQLGLTACGMEGYGCAGGDVVSAGMVAFELGRRDAGMATFFSILQPISMSAIYKCGSEEQKQEFLPRMASMDLIGCFCLTEPYAGSDASSLQTTATPTADGGWILNGQKRWIGNGTFADIYIIWARNTASNQVHGFIVDKDTPGLTSTKIENKIALRCVQNADISLVNCRVSESRRLTHAENFATGPGKCLFLTRLSTAWIACGMAIGALEATLDYATKRHQFGHPLTKMQITQERLARMLSITQSMCMLTWRASVMCDQDELSLGQVGLVKAHATSQARVVLSLAREIVGGNGILTDYVVAQHFTDIEALHTFEGTYDINVLIGMRELTRQSALKPR